ncbi:MAG: hypothetical protein U0930_24105 [Pirellulales bacterium]
MRESLKRRVSESSEEIRERHILLVAGKFGIPEDNLDSPNSYPGFKLLDTNSAVESLQQYSGPSRVDGFLQLDDDVGRVSDSKVQFQAFADLLEILNKDYPLSRSVVWIPVIQ